MKDFVAVAHRGGEGPHPENTRESFQHAIKHGAKAIEMDLRFDYFHQRFFVEHDFFHLPKKRQNTLDTLLKSLPKDLIIFAEIKTLSCFSNYLAKKFVATFEKLFDSEKTIVISFNPFILMRLKKLSPGMKVGILCSKNFWNYLFQKFFYTSIKPSVYLLHHRILNKKNADFGKKYHMKVIPFVLNKDFQWNEALSLNVDGIITDRTIELNKKMTELKNSKGV